MQLYLFHLKALILFLTFPLLIIGQNETFQFRSPLDIPIFLSANFGELRSNHFHSGIDIKTQGTIGKHVYAIEKGYVSRIKTSPYGYGRSIYITHPNGMVSVYAHLHRYSKRIDKIATGYQYKNKVNLYDIEFPPYEIPVEKGEIIAYSGNSGGSGGPHLHFEIRDQISEEALNPLQFYPDITDNIKPRIDYISIYPLDSCAMVNSLHRKLTLKPQNIGNGQYSISTPIAATGTIGIGINGKDYFSYVHNIFGFYSVELYRNDSLVYAHTLNKINFAESININSLIDYEHYKYSRAHIQKSFIDANNKFGIYQSQAKDGKLYIKNGTTNKFTYKVSDFNGNKTTLHFSIESDSIPCGQSTNRNVHEIGLKYYKANVIEGEYFSVYLPKGVLYNNDFVSFTEIRDTSLSLFFSPVISFSPDAIPLKRPIKLNIQLNSFPENLRHKLQIYSLKNGRPHNAYGGTISGNYIETTIKAFYSYAVCIDTIPPTIQPIRLYDNCNVQHSKTISFRVKDNLSGIAFYNAYIDNTWVILDYDAKYKLLNLHFDDKITTRNKKHLLHLIVEDGVMNSTEYTLSFYW